MKLDFTEINRLKTLLDEYGIPYEYRTEGEPGDPIVMAQIIYPDAETWVADVVCNYIKINGEYRVSNSRNRSAKMVSTL